jgi:hypothetical protein
MFGMWSGWRDLSIGSKRQENFEGYYRSEVVPPVISGRMR